MAKSAYNPDELFFSDEDDSFLEQRLEKFSKIDSKAKSHRSTITRLMPLIRGCRDKGHSWEFIAGIFQERYPGLSAALLRKVVYEIEPSLKPSSAKKAVHQVESLIPELEENKAHKVKQSKAVVNAIPELDDSEV
ncbi:MAG: hypothetical protein HC790_03410 [Acaryochloridaceae cyanobacterium CSU_3_4]|nr:hypothetical protein [Acaryochloridaceae cyanobacterium CSU_3_4]